MSAKFLSLLAVSFFATANAAQIDVEDWVVPFDGPKEWQASVGDTMSFFWPEFHDVWIHPTGNCTLADRVEIGKQSGASYTFADTDGSAEGTRHFFACDVGDGAHCRFGQFLTVTVYSGDAPGGSGVVPAIAPTPVEETPAMEDTMEDSPMTDEEKKDDMSGATFNTVSAASLVGLVGAVLALAL